MIRDDEIVLVSCCTDCAMISANGEGASDGWDADAYAEATRGYTVAVDMDYGFSRWTCDLCGSRLAGDRWHASLIPSGVTA